LRVASCLPQISPVIGGHPQTLSAAWAVNLRAAQAVAFAAGPEGHRGLEAASGVADLIHDHPVYTTCF